MVHRVVVLVLRCVVATNATPPHIRIASASCSALCSTSGVEFRDVHASKADVVWSGRLRLSDAFTLAWACSERMTPSDERIVLFTYASGGYLVSQIVTQDA